MSRFCLACIFCIGWMAAIDFGSQAAASHPVQYSVSFSDADRHLIDVEVTVPIEGETVELMMPVWTPGSYLVREYARNIESIAAFDAATAEPLEIRKSAKNRWVVTGGDDTETVRVRYRLYCREMSVRTNWVEHDFAVLVGAGTFVTGTEMLDRPHHVRFVLPTHWKQSVTALAPIPGQADAYIADSFDTLVDSPVVLGNPKITRFVAGDKHHMLVTLNDGGLWDNDRAADDVKRIVETQHEFWGTVPYERYIFFNVVGESGGGLEHDNGTLLMTSRWAYGDPDRYLGWLGLVSHEFFHTWNVRRLRPRVLSSYNYDEENYFNELWIAEGITSYFDDLLQVRSGLLSEADYFKRLSGTLKSVQTAPGTAIQSLSDSSYDAWIKYYRPDENAVNSRVSYYSKGSLVALLLDTKIRDATNGEKSLQDVMRTMYDEYALEKGGYDLSDFRRIVDQVSGQPLSEWLAKAVDGTDMLDFQPVLDRYGLKLGETSNEDGKGDDDKTEDEPQDGTEDSPTGKELTDTEPADETSADEQPKVKLAEAAIAKKPKTPYIGATVREQDGKIVVTQIVRGGPADRAGWNVDDELLAIGDFRATDSLVNQHLAQFPVGSPIETLLSRRGQLMHRPLTLEAHQSDAWKLGVVKKATDEQAENRRKWLAQPN
jgi:predicted metalloprotease with PDZ domain